MSRMLKLRKGVSVITILALVLGSFTLSECVGDEDSNKAVYQAINCRKHSAVLTDFGGVGDGKTSNTEAFRSAIQNLSKFSSNGGSQLIVPPGKWLTGSFNLTSNFTLYLHKDATILFSQNESEYPSVAVLPSYGKDGARHGAFIFGVNLTDVVITGNNGTIDGQGAYWWAKFTKKENSSYTKPNLIEFVNCNGVQLSDITLLNSPSWNVHPVYSSNILFKGLTILAPVTVPNTDGINPDSCTNVRIEDCYIVSGDDCIAVKSGWDQYGIQVGMPTKHLIVRRLTCISPKSAGIAIGSEMSGGIQDVRAEDITLIDTESAVRIKTAIGRGAYVRDIFVKGLTMENMRYVFWMTGSYQSHPDEGYDPKALPVIKGISYRDVIGKNVNMTGDLAGIQGDPFTDICISNATLNLSPTPKKVQWNCTDIQGVVSNVSPKPCELLKEASGTMQCPFPTDILPIDKIRLKTCTLK